jgi:hypothetical protein
MAPGRFEAIPMAQQHARRAAADWRTDPQAAVDIEAHLERSGFDQIDINAQVIAQARELFLVFAHLMQSAQSRQSHCCVKSASVKNLRDALVRL